MSDKYLIKATLINAAYLGAIAVLDNVEAVDSVPVAADSLMKDVGLQKKAVLVYEEAKVQYNALLRAFHDQTGIWPDPQLPADAGGQPLINSANAAVGALQAVASGLSKAGIPAPAVGIVGSAIQSAIAALTNPASVQQTPIAPPGSDIPTATPGQAK